MNRHYVGEAIKDRIGGLGIADILMESIELYSQAFGNLALQSTGGSRAYRSRLRKGDRTGLSAGSIIRAHSLYCPARIQKGELEAITNGNEWVAFDFAISRRCSLRQGTLASFLLNDIRHRDSEHLTRTGKLNIYDIRHRLQLEFPSIEYLANHGMVEESTYRESFEKAGIFDQYEREIIQHGIGAKRLFRVTPKGNGLVFVVDNRREVDPKKPSEFHNIFEPIPISSLRFL